MQVFCGTYQTAMITLESSLTTREPSVAKAGSRVRVGSLTEGWYRVGSRRSGIRRGGNLGVRDLSSDVREVGRGRGTVGTLCNVLCNSL